jgi:hypothetical protein
VRSSWVNLCLVKVDPSELGMFNGVVEHSTGSMHAPELLSKSSMAKVSEGVVEREVARVDVSELLSRASMARAFSIPNKYCGEGKMLLEAESVRTRGRLLL